MKFSLFIKKHSNCLVESGFLILSLEAAMWIISNVN